MDAGNITRTHSRLKAADSQWLLSKGKSGCSKDKPQMHLELSTWGGKPNVHTNTKWIQLGGTCV